MPARSLRKRIHPIRVYCDERGITQTEFADLVGFSIGFVSQLICGSEVCGRSAALQIVDKTNGEIDLGALIRWKSKQEEADQR